jgi:hypothetical protein
MDEALVVFHMLFPHGLACEERSLSLASDMPPV